MALVRARSRRESFTSVLDTAALAEEAARQAVADFPRFRTDFRATGTFRDPGPAVLELEGRLLAIDNARRTVAVLDSLARLFVERSQGLSSGLNRIDIDMVFARSARAPTPGGRHQAISRWARCAQNPARSLAAPVPWYSTGRM